MPISRLGLRTLGRISILIVDIVVAAGILAVAAFIWLESGWVRPSHPQNLEEAFRRGTIGTELLPMPLVQVLPLLAPQHFVPKPCKDWISCFGFISDENANNSEALPVGFAVSRYRPRSGSPSPVAFVGFSCALCHTTALHTAPGVPPIIERGPGNASLNLFAWLDAVQAALLEREAPGANGFDPVHPAPYKITFAKIEAAYQEKTGRTLGLLESLMMRLWLSQFRSTLEAGLPRFDEPFGEGKSRRAEFVPTGPTRTQPFRTLVRQVLNRPGDDMAVYTKIATVFSEDLRDSAQFDGSITDLYARSSMAALAAGATVQNMTLPEIVEDIRSASDYTRSLRPPRFEALFPDAATDDSVRLQRGHQVYREHCYSCHGDRAAATYWEKGPRTGEIISLTEIKSDPERVTFRHYDELPNRLYLLFPKDHPFHFERSEMRQSDGYVAAPLDGMFLRAPYLHNGSVPTLAQLINLQRRPDVFFRGGDLYDPQDVGFKPAPDKADQYFEFDTRLRGNSNRGHDYPWQYDPNHSHDDDLKALLDYLKTL